MKWIVFIAVLLGFASAASAQELAGRVVDAADGRPLAGAILLAADSTGRQAGYTTSATDGTFRLRPRQGMRAAWIDVSMMGYRAQRFDAARLPQELRLEASAVAIREVEIRAPRLSLRGDTVSYNVASFTEAQDRTIADVLRKMPGIEVEKTGEIRYNGEAINKFYIEGMDMLDGRYSLATNNIAPQDVASVEVMENHQPIKALRDVLYSDRAALNLRLKKQARSHWTGTLRGAGGWSPDEALGSGSAFAMRIAAQSQSMLNLKGDNTGEDPTADLHQLTVEEMLNGADNRYEVPAWFSTGLSEAPLDDSRTRLNRSVMTSADHLRKLTDDYQLSGHVAYGYDRLTSDCASRIVRYLSDGELAEELAEQAGLTDRQLAAHLKLLANTERFYLMDRLSADLAWSDFDAATTGSYPNRQQTEAPAYRMENDLNYIRRSGRRTLTVTSNLLWLTQPQQLDVVRDGSAQRQTLDVDLLRMNHNVAWGLEAGRRWLFLFKGGIAALYRRFDSSLNGLGIETSAPLAAENRFGYGSLYLRPTATYRTQRLRLMFALPVDWRYYRYTGGSDSPLLWSANLSARWTPSACWTLSASGAAGEQGAADATIYPTVLLRDYRTLASGVALPVSTPVRMLAAGANYKNPLSGIFAHLFLQRPRGEPHGVVEPRVGREHQHRRPARSGGGRSRVERHPDGDPSAGDSDALPLGRADPLAAREPPRSTLVQCRIHVQLPLHATADRISRPDRPPCVRPAAATQLYADPKSGPATDRRALPHTALRHAEQAPRAGRCLGTLEGRRAMGALGFGGQSAQRDGVRLHALRRVELFGVPLRHPAVQPAAGGKLAVLKRNTAKCLGPVSSTNF